MAPEPYGVYAFDPKFKPQHPAAERRHPDSKTVKDFHLKAEARIWL
jgi:hypothetical protein